MKISTIGLNIYVKIFGWPNHKTFPKALKEETTSYSVTKLVKKYVREFKIYQVSELDVWKYAQRNLNI